MNDEMKEKIYTFDRDDMDSDDMTIEDLAQNVDRHPAPTPTRHVSDRLETQLDELYFLIKERLVQESERLLGE